MLVKDVKKLVKNVIRKFGSNNPFILCEALGIIVRFEDLGNIRGVFLSDKRKKIIHVNCNLDSNIQRQVCAHELGHALLHNVTNTVFWDTHTYLVTDKIEAEANMFAAELLIDDMILKEFEGYSQDHIANILGVQERMVEYKFTQLLKNHIL
jgi:Zn-dependent peptidase ImmA (M78 family)